MGGGGRGERSGGWGGRVGWVRVDVNEELKFLWKFGVGLGGQGGCERRIEVFVKIKKKFIFFWGGGGSGGGGWGGSGWM